MAILFKNKKEQERLLLDEIRKNIRTYDGLALINFSGLTIEEDNTIRRAAKDLGLEYKVYKASQVQEAAKYSDFEALIPHMEGPTGFLFFNTRKTLVDFAHVVNKTLRDPARLSLRDFFRAAMYQDHYYDITAVVEKQLAEQVAKEKAGLEAIQAGNTIYTSDKLHLLDDNDDIICSVELTDHNMHVVATIKAINDVLRIGLSESKSLVDRCPVVVKSGCTVKEAKYLLNKLIEVGATARIFASAKAPVAAKQDALPVDNHTYSVELTTFGAFKMDVIKAIVHNSNNSLVEAKNLVESCPVIVQKRLSNADSLILRKALEDAGGIVKIIDEEPVQVSSQTNERTVNYKIRLLTKGNNSIQTIVEVREVTMFGLKEAKDLVDTCPNTIKENISHEEAVALEKKFSLLGCETEIIEMHDAL